MPDVDKLLRDYVAEHRAGGEADPRGYLEQTSGTDRVELLARIDRYLAGAPGAAWDPGSYAGSAAEKLAGEIAAGWSLDEPGEEATEGWRELLPALRHRAKILRRAVIERLAAEIGHPGQTQRVAEYYHQMEHGTLPAEGVSDRVLEALARILGESAERLRRAGSVVTPGGDTQDQAMAKVAFARKAVKDSRFDAPAAPLTDASRSEEAGSVADAAAVDELFTGGPDAG